MFSKTNYLHLLLLQECLEPLQLLHHQRISLEIGEVVVHPKQQNAGHLEVNYEKMNEAFLVLIE